ACRPLARQQRSPPPRLAPWPDPPHAPPPPSFSVAASRPSRQLLRHHAAPVSRGQLRLVLPPVDRHRRAGAEPVHSTPPGGNGDMAARHKDAGASSARVPALASSRLTAARPRNAPAPRRPPSHP